LPGRFQIPFEDVERVEDVLDRTPVAAVVVEPVQGIGGARPWAPDRLRALLECCRSHGTLVIVDEVLTGVGRTGDWFAFQHAGIEPDVVVTSKGLTGGIVPVAAVLMTERVHRSVYSSMERAMAHQVTFEAHLLGMSVATAVLDVVETGGLVDRAAAVGVRLRAVLDDMRSAGRGIIGVRGRGLLVAFQVAPTGDPSAAEDAALCMELLMERGVLVYPPAHAPGWLKLTPPLTMSDASVEAFRSALEDALKELTDYRAAS
jgi:acetylornithine/succinyldiaminopimelate/putrescine aminotransferase